MLYSVKWLLALAGIISLYRCAPENSAQVNLPKEREYPDTVTYWNHIQPIVFENCTPCHHKEGAAPFALTAYADLAKRSKTVHLAIADGFMPPWPADTTYSRFKGEKTLTAYERSLVLKWLKTGMPEGIPPQNTPGFKQAKTQLGEPDKIIYFPDTVHLAGGTKDAFFIAKVPFELDRDTVLKAIEFIPGNRQLAHHVNGHLINYQEGAKTDHHAGEWILWADSVNSLDAYQRMQIQNDDGTYPPLLVSAFNYLPGVEPVAYPHTLGNMIIAKKGAFMLNTLHYGPTAIDTTDRSQIRLYYAEKRPDRPLKELQLGTLGLSEVVPKFIIPAGEVKSFSTRYRLSEDISVLTINPHMHLLGQTFHAYAVSTNKSDTIPLIRINEWDFRWQFFYTYAYPLKIPRGYEVVVEASFDNTIHNPFNPFHPPQTLVESDTHMKTTDEMFQFFITYVPYRPGDEKIPL